MHPYIYRTHDGGKTWKLITAGLPDFGPVDTVREDPVRKGLLFAGTENAVWVSFDDGDHWQSLQLNLPHTSMRDLWIHEDDLIVATHGRSFWILDDIAPLRETLGRDCERSRICSPRRPLTASSATPTPTRRLPPDEPAAANPPDGAILDYYLPVGGIERHARNSGCAGSSRPPLLQHRQAGHHRGRIAEAVDSAVLGAQAPATLDRSRNAPLGLGPALSRAGIDAPRISDRGDSARHAALAAGADGSAGHLHGAAHGRRKNFQRAADDQDGPARQDFGGGACRKNSRRRRGWLRS